jgi:hypothetical protein
MSYICERFKKHQFLNYTKGMKVLSLLALAAHHTIPFMCGQRPDTAALFVRQFLDVGNL